MLRIVSLALSVGLAASTRIAPKKEIVLARYDEDVEWAKAAYGDNADIQLMVYCKAEFEDECPANSIPLPNLGRESHTYLTHIVRNYDALADWTVFSQAEAPSFGYSAASHEGGHMLAGVTFDDYVFFQDREPHADSAFFFSSAVTLPTLSHTLRMDYVLEDLPGASNDVCPKPGLDGWSDFFEMSHLKRVLDRKRKAQQGVDSMQYYEEFVAGKPIGADEVTLSFSQGARFAVTRQQIRSRPRAYYQKLLASVSNTEDVLNGYWLEYMWYDVFHPEALQVDTGSICELPAATEVYEQFEMVDRITTRFLSEYEERGVPTRRILEDVSCYCSGGQCGGISVPASCPQDDTTICKDGIPYADNVAGCELAVDEFEAVNGQTFPLDDADCAALSREERDILFSYSACCGGIENVACAPDSEEETFCLGEAPFDEIPSIFDACSIPYSDSFPASICEDLFEPEDAIFGVALPDACKVYNVDEEQCEGLGGELDEASCEELPAEMWLKGFTFPIDDMCDTIDKSDARSREVSWFGSLCCSVVDAAPIELPTACDLNLHFCSADEYYNPNGRLTIDGDRQNCYRWMIEASSVLGEEGANSFYNKEAADVTPAFCEQDFPFNDPEDDGPVQFETIRDFSDAFAASCCDAVADVNKCIAPGSPTAGPTMAPTASPTASLAPTRAEPRATAVVEPQLSFESLPFGPGDTEAINDMVQVLLTTILNLLGFTEDQVDASGTLSPVTESRRLAAEHRRLQDTEWEFEASIEVPYSSVEETADSGDAPADAMATWLDGAVTSLNDEIADGGFEDEMNEVYTEAVEEAAANGETFAGISDPQQVDTVTSSFDAEASVVEQGEISTGSPTAAPTDAPTEEPTLMPTTDAPTAALSAATSTAPTEEPTLMPTDAPTTMAPTPVVTDSPTDPESSAAGVSATLALALAVAVSVFTAL